MTICACRVVANHSALSSSRRTLLRDKGGIRSTSRLLDPHDLSGDRRHVRKCVLDGHIMVRRIAFEALQIKAESRSFGSGTRQPADDSRIVRKYDSDSLMLCAALVHRVDVGKVIAKTGRQ